MGITVTAVILTALFATNVPFGAAEASASATSPGTTPPAATMLPSINAPWCFIEATGASTSTASKCVASSATSAAGAAITPTETIPSSLSIGLHKITVRAEDSGGNWASTTRVILVNDTSAPTITVPNTFTKPATAPQTPISESEYGAPSGTDTVSPPVSASCNVPTTLPVAPPRNFACTATDARDNSVGKEFSIVITDKVPPRFTPPVSSKITIEASAPYTRLVAGNIPITASDNASDYVTITPDVEYVAVEERRMVTWTATDSAGNSAKVTQEVTVQDTTKPFVFAPRDVSVMSSVPVSASLVDLGSPIVFDLGDPDPKVKNNAPAQFPLGTTAVTWTATDNWDNQKSATQNVVVGTTVTSSSSKILWTFADIQHKGVDWVTDIAVLPDDLIVVSGWFDSEVFVLNSTDGSLVRLIENTRPHYGFSIAALNGSSTDKKFAVSDNKKTVHVYDDHKDLSPNEIGSLRAPNSQLWDGVIVDSLGDKLVVYQNNRMSAYSTSNWDRPLYQVNNLNSRFALPNSMETSEHGTTELIFVGPTPTRRNGSVYLYDGSDGSSVATIDLPNTWVGTRLPQIAVSDDGRSLFAKLISTHSGVTVGKIWHYDRISGSSNTINEPQCCVRSGNSFEYEDGKLYVMRNSSTHMEFAVYDVSINSKTNTSKNAFLGTVSIPRTEISGASSYAYPTHTIRHIEGSTFLTAEHISYGGKVVRLIHAVDLSNPTLSTGSSGQASPSSLSPMQAQLVEPTLVSTKYVEPNLIKLTYSNELDPHVAHTTDYKLSEGWSISKAEVNGRVIILTYVELGESGERPSISEFGDMRYFVYPKTVEQNPANSIPPPPPPPPPQREAPSE